MMTEEKNANDKIKVSVIIPVYNVEKYLKRCVDSVLNQSFRDYEILLINDGSTDGSWKIIKDYLGKYPLQIKAYSKENGGLSSARNYALDRVNGEYVTFLDSDDYLDSDYLERLYKAAKDNNSDMVCSGQKKVGADGHTLAVLSYPVDKNPSCILRRLNISGKIYRREYIEKHHMRFADGKIYEDDPFNLVMLFLAKNFVILHYEGYNQLVRQGSITSYKIDASKMPYKALEKSIAYVVSHKSEINDYDVFEYTVLSFFTYFIFQANKKHMYLAKNKERRSDISTVLKFCDFTLYILKKYMPKYEKNPHIKLYKNIELQLFQRLGVWGYVKLCRLHMLKVFTRLYYKI